MEEEDSYPFGSDHFLSGAENYPLHKAMVNHNQQGIEAREGREVSDQVAGDLLEGARGVGLDRGEQGDGGVCVRFVLLACGTAFDVFAHKLRETRPPKFRADELAGLKVARVSGSLVIMAVGKNGAMEGVLQGDVDMAFIS